MLSKSPNRSNSGGGPSKHKTMYNFSQYISFAGHLAVAFVDVQPPLIHKRFRIHKADDKVKLRYSAHKTAILAGSHDMSSTWHANQG